MSMYNKDFKGQTATFGSVVLLRYKRVDLKKSFDIFCEKLYNYDIKEVKDAEYVLIIIQNLNDPKYLLDFKNKTNDLTTE